VDSYHITTLCLQLCVHLDGQISIDVMLLKQVTLNSEQAQLYRRDVQ